MVSQFTEESVRAVQSPLLTAVLYLPSSYSPIHLLVGVIVTLCKPWVR